MTRLNEYINAVLLNNPRAVALNMQQLGVLQGESYDPELLKQGLYSHLQQNGDYGLPTLLDALDVPVDYNGQAANELASYHTIKANRAVLESLLVEMMGPYSESPAIGHPTTEITIPIRAVLNSLVVMLIITLILFLIRKM